MSRIESTARKRQMLDAACHIARVVGVKHVTLAAVARHCNVSATLVAQHFGTRAKLQRAVNKELGE